MEVIAGPQMLDQAGADRPDRPRQVELDGAVISGARWAGDRLTPPRRGAAP